MKDQVREVYRTCVSEGSLNLSGARISFGRRLAEELGYPEKVLRDIPESHWNTFAGCGNPWPHVKVKPCWKILDVGCGSGIDAVTASRYLAPGGLVVGIDFVHEMIDACRRLAESLPPYRRCCMYFLEGDGEGLPFRANTFDLVVCNGVFSLFEAKKRALEEIYRVLKNGGTLVVCDLIRLCALPQYFYECGDSWSWCMLGAPSRVEIENLFKDVGFSTVRFSWGRAMDYFGRATVTGVKKSG